MPLTNPTLIAALAEADAASLELPHLPTKARPPRVASVTTLARTPAPATAGSDPLSVAYRAAVKGGYAGDPLQFVEQATQAAHDRNGMQLADYLRLLAGDDALVADFLKRYGKQPQGPARPEAGPATNLARRLSPGVLALARQDGRDPSRYLDDRPLREQRDGLTARLAAARRGLPMPGQIGIENPLTGPEAAFIAAAATGYTAGPLAFESDVSRYASRAGVDAAKVFALMIRDAGYLRTVLNALPTANRATDPFSAVLSRQRDTAGDRESLREQRDRLLDRNRRQRHGLGGVR